MCGIAGVLEHGGRSASRDDIEAMVDRIAHRGPDHHDVLVDGPLGLGAARLSIVDLSDAGAQPFADRRAALTFNGEIYNHRALGHELEADGVVFNGRSDTEVLFHALGRWGLTDTLPRLRGMFAFAYADRARHTVALARDPLGIKPLLWTAPSGRLAWASEAKALGVITPLVPDPVQAVFAVTGRIERSSTLTAFRDIEQVPAGHCLQAGMGSEPVLSAWWTLVDQVDGSLYEELRRCSPEALVDQFDDLLSSAVRRMSQSDAPAGTFLSGGVDSSLISATAAADPGIPTPALFTADVGGSRSERAAAQRTADHLGQPLEVATFPRTALLDDWARATWHLETPLVTHVNALPFGRLAVAAHEYPVKTVLTGEGADELFFGYGAAVRDRYPTILREPSQAVRWATAHLPHPVRAVLTPGAAGSQGDFLVDLVGHFQTDRLRHAGTEAFAFLEPDDARRHGAVVGWLGEHLPTLLHRNDAMGMAVAVEARFPFLDEDLVRFGINLPIQAKVAASRHLGNRRHPFLRDKAIVREAAARRLPVDVAERPKDGFPLYGHDHVRTTPAFWSGGYVADLLGLPASALTHLAEGADRYHAAKLASVEIFGRVFALGDDLDAVTDHLRRHARVIT